MKRLLILQVPNIDGAGFPSTRVGATSPVKAMHEANIVIVKSPTHFRCVKNRFDAEDGDEKIPNFLLKPYLLRYSNHFTTEELLDSLL